MGTRPWSAPISAPVIPFVSNSREFMSMQKGQETRNDVYILMSARSRRGTSGSSWATSPSMIPDPMKAFGYQVRIRFASSFFPMRRSTIQSRRRGSRGIFSGGSR